MGKLRDHREKTGERTCVIIGKYSECFLNVVLINICIKTVAAEDSLCWLRDFRPAVALISPVGQWQDYNPRKKIIHAYSVLIYSLCCCFINIKLYEVFTLSTIRVGITTSPLPNWTISTTSGYFANLLRLFMSDLWTMIKCFRFDVTILLVFLAQTYWRKKEKKEECISFE